MIEPIEGVEDADMDKLVAVPADQESEVEKQLEEIIMDDLDEKKRLLPDEPSEERSEKRSAARGSK